jgi:hypothetical protein
VQRAAGALRQGVSDAGFCLHRRDVLKAGGALVVSFTLAERFSARRRSARKKTVAPDEVDGFLSIGD